MLTCIKQQARFEVQFIKKLINTEAELKKSVACKVIFFFIERNCSFLWASSFAVALL